MPEGSLPCSPNEHATTRSADIHVYMHTVYELCYTYDEKAAGIVMSVDGVWVCSQDGVGNALRENTHGGHEVGRELDPAYGNCNRTSASLVPLVAMRLGMSLTLHMASAPLPQPARQLCH